MPRARSIKPGFFRNELLCEMQPWTRLLFIGLWTIADRSGRLEDRPKRIKAEVFPYDNFNIDNGLEELSKAKFIIRYEVAGIRYIAIPTWCKHQNPHVKEAASTIPAPCEHSTSTVLAPEIPERALLTPDSGLLTPDSGNPVLSVTLTETPAQSLAESLLKRHPRKGEPILVEQIVVEMLAPLPEAEQWKLVGVIDARHQRWCKSAGWKLQNGKNYAPKLSNWLREGGWREDPPHEDEDEKPVKRSSAGIDPEAEWYPPWQNSTQT